MVSQVGSEAFYGRVTAAAGATALASAATLGDVIPEIDLAVQGDPTSGQISATSGAIAAAAVPVRFDQATIDAYQALEASGRLGTTCKSTLTSNEVPIWYDANVSLSFVFEPSWGWKGMNRLKVAVRPYVSFAAGVNIGGSFECALDVGLWSQNLPPIRFAIGPVPVVIAVQLDVKANAHITTEAGLDVTVGASLGPEASACSMKTVGSRRSPR